MSLYMILYAAGAIVGVWGPLPYDKAECEARREELNTEIARVIETKRGVFGNVPSEDALAQLRTWRMACEHHVKRPALAARAKGGADGQ